MQDKELYEKLLGLKAPWRVSDVDLRMDESKVTVKLAHELLARFPCPECGLEGPTHDHRPRQWRHLDTCGFITMVEADVPRVDCPVHGVPRPHPFPFLAYSLSTPRQKAIPGVATRPGIAA